MDYLYLNPLKRGITHYSSSINKKVMFTPRPQGEIQDGRHTGLTYQLVHEHLGYFSRLWAY